MKTDVIKYIFRRIYYFFYGRRWKGLPLNEKERRAFEEHDKMIQGVKAKKRRELFAKFDKWNLSPEARAEIIGDDEDEIYA